MFFSLCLKIIVYCYNRLQTLTSFQEDLFQQYQIPLIGFTHPSTYKRFYYHNPSQFSSQQFPFLKDLPKSSMPAYYQFHVNTRLQPKVAAFHALMGMIYDLYEDTEDEQQEENQKEEGEKETDEQSTYSSKLSTRKEEENTFSTRRPFKKPKIISIITDDCMNPVTQAVISHYLSSETKIPFLAFDSHSFLPMTVVEREKELLHFQGEQTKDDLKDKILQQFPGKDDHFMSTNRFHQLFQDYLTPLFIQERQKQLNNSMVINREKVISIQVLS
jgi:hypothetical protein